MPNRLANETSPYLLQHAHNPVDWLPWGDEALVRAKTEDRPILLSVGYSACHWCHVMERESFEDPEVAARMNGAFVNVKVDREERPDLDELYMQAVQAFTGGHGGWPMTVFLTPDGRPWFGGTYFPPVPSHGMPSFTQVLQHAERVWRERRAEIEAVGDEVAGHLRGQTRMPAPATALHDTWLDAVAEAAAQDYDTQHGGFGGAPKFPPHGTLAVLLAHHQRRGDPRSLEMALHTLRQMARGGMYDLLSGGFARYSVDPRWCVPHFEKMLYDNGQLIPIYLDAWRVSGDGALARVARDSLEWALREMRLPEGAFAASQDADSEGVEGRYFAWTPAQVREVLGLVDGLRACTLLNVRDQGSFEHGSSVLRVDTMPEDLPAEDQALLARVLPRLHQARGERVAPGRDDKVIVAWNALMIRALARGATALCEPRYLAAAEQAVDFILGRVTVDGRLRRTWRAGRVGPLACLDDHAGLVLALVELYEASLDDRHLERALALADRTLALFGDDPSGGLWFTGHDAEALVTRPRNLIGGATPSGAGLAALGFARLAALCGREDLGQRADAVLRSYQALLPRAARALGEEALAATWRAALHPELGVAGPDVRPLLAEVSRRYLPFVAIAGPSPWVPWMRERVPLGGPATAWLCEGGACRLPVTDPAALGAQLDEALRPRAPGG